MTDGKIEVTTAPKPESKPVAAAPTKEKMPTPLGQTKTPSEVHQTLEKIAQGVPVAEATNPPEFTLSKDVAEKLLHEANALLLDIKDMRLLTAAVATQAADTPLGNEVRVDALRMIAKMSNADMPPESVVRLDALQKQIAELHIPDPKPEQSILIQTIQNYNATHPDQTVPDEVIGQIKSGKIEASDAVAKLIGGKTPLGQEIWKQLTNVDEFSGFYPTPEIVLDLAGIEKTPDNLTKANAIFGAVKATHEPMDIVGKIMPGVMVGALGLMFFSQLATGELGGGAGGAQH